MAKAVRAFLLLVAIHSGWSGIVMAQGPQIDVVNPPGVPKGRGRLGRAIGASGTSSFENPSESERPIGGRTGASVSRAPVGGFQSPRPRGVEAPAEFKLPPLPESRVPQYGALDLPLGPEDLGPETGLTLDQAIERLVRENLALMALRYEIPMAAADVLTASLRANPIFYADAQLVPYGHYSNDRPGGQRQFDVNVTYPIDVTRKRAARTQMAKAARRVTEAQLQDAIRLQIDNLYTVYVDVVAAGETVAYSRAYAKGAARLLQLNQARLDQGQVAQPVVDALKAQSERAELQVRESEEALVTHTRALAVLLNIPRNEADGLEVRAALRDVAELPMAEDAIIRQALETRPDLVAQRLGVHRAEADAKLARANRYSDVYLLYQPYTLQDNSPFGLKSAYSWAVGATATMPLFNRNQGNIARADMNRRQTTVELAALERQVAHEVETAVREFRLSLRSVIEIEREVLPASKRVRDTAERRLEAGAIDALVYLEAEREFNQVVREYRDALVRHRRAVLDLNTAVGARLIP